MKKMYNKATMDKVLEHKLHAFFSKYPAKQFRKHQILIQSDQEPSGIFYLKKGVVRTYAITANGEELTLNIFRPIAFFPMSWAINGTVSPYYFEAMTEVETYVAPQDDVLTFIQQNPDVTINLLSRVYKGLDGLMTHMEYLMVGSANARLIVTLLIAAKRFGDVSKGDVKIELPMTHNDLAMQAGMSRETVTRELKSLKEHSIAEMKHGHVIIHDLTKLEQALYR